MIGIALIVVEQDCDNCGWHCDNCVFFPTIVVGVVTIVVDCDNCEHCNNCDHITVADNDLHLIDLTQKLKLRCPFKGQKK